MAKESTPNQPGLYGLSSSNRKPSDYWGKNIFNNVFPMSLAVWLRDHRIDTPFIQSTDGTFRCTLQPPDLLLGLPHGKSPHFDFESTFKAHSQLCQDKSERVDVVICDKDNRKQEYRYLEIKLVVVPDSASSNKSPQEWAPEIVFRPSTSTNCTLSIFRHLNKLNKQKEALSLLDPVCSKIHGWGNPAEMRQASADLLPLLKKIITITEPLQEPVVACTIWRTDGVSPILAENAFDIFAWTSTAFMHMLCDKAMSNTRRAISRPERSALRGCRVLYELLSSKRVYLERVISDMSFDKQDDKDFSINGNQTIKYMKHGRLLNPAIRRDAIEDIIIGNGIDILSPERRLDATLYFAYKYATKRRM